ncbi:MAG: hypothetical protein AB7I45_05570 [Planctomycetota bacterium]
MHEATGRAVNALEGRSVNARRSAIVAAVRAGGLWLWRLVAPVRGGRVTPGVLYLRIGLAVVWVALFILFVPATREAKTTALGAGVLAGAGAYLAHALRRRARERDTFREWALDAQARYEAALHSVAGWRPPRAGEEVAAWGVVGPLQHGLLEALGSPGLLAGRATFDAPRRIATLARAVDCARLELDLADAEVAPHLSIRPVRIAADKVDLFQGVRSEVANLGESLRLVLRAIRIAAEE